MPAKSTVKKAKKQLRQGKAPSTVAGEFVHEEIEHVRQGKHGARSSKQAIAIGLSKARRAGVPLKPPKRGKAKETTRRSAERDYRKGQTSAAGKKTSRRSSRAHQDALKREPRNTASHRALSKQARSAAKRRKSSSGKSTSRSAANKRASRSANKKRTAATSRKTSTRNATRRSSQQKKAA